MGEIQKSSSEIPEISEIPVTTSRQTKDTKEGSTEDKPTELWPLQGDPHERLLDQIYFEEQAKKRQQEASKSLENSTTTKTEERNIEEKPAELWPLQGDPHEKLLDQIYFQEQAEKRQQEAKLHQEKTSEEKKELSPTEKKNNIVDEKMNDLLVLAGDSPEAEQEAVKIFIGQMEQIGEQMKLVRDAENLQELKLLMAKHWEELQAAAGGNPELLNSIQNWGKDFINSKAMYYEFMNGLKADLTYKSLEISNSWLAMQINIGSLIRDAKSSDPKIEEKINNILYKNSFLRQVAKDSDRIKSLDLKERESNLELFVSSLTKFDTGYSSGDIDIESLSGFYTDLGRVVSELSSNPEANTDTLKELLQQMTLLQKQAKEAIDTFASTKKLKENHFLDIFNEVPGSDIKPYQEKMNNDLRLERNDQGNHKLETSIYYEPGTKFPKGEPTRFRPETDVPIDPKMIDEIIRRIRPDGKEPSMLGPQIEEEPIDPKIADAIRRILRDDYGLYPQPPITNWPYPGGRERRPSY